MHMADALVSPAVAGTMYAVSAAAAGYSIYKVKKEDDASKIPVMGVMGAFVFAAQMINFTIPGTGFFRTFVRWYAFIGIIRSIRWISYNDRRFICAVSYVC